MYETIADKLYRVSKLVKQFEIRPDLKAVNCRKDEILINFTTLSYNFRIFRDDNVWNDNKGISFDKLKDLIRKNFDVKWTIFDSDKQLELIKAWDKIGKLNPWIKQGNDPIFDLEDDRLKSYMNSKFENKAFMFDKMNLGNWCLGETFFYNDICFINQVNGGNEWLVIKGKTSFESLTLTTFDSFISFMDRVEKATEAQCKKLEYYSPN